MSSPSMIVLITGANSGVGYATAKVIASASASYHVIMCSRNLENGNKALDDIQKGSGVKGTLSLTQLDVNSRASIEAAAKQVDRQFGRVDVLLNNAGIVSQATTLEDEIESTMRTNVIGPALVMEAFLPLLLKSKSPYSIYVSSGIGSLGMAADLSRSTSKSEYTVYGMSKAALNMMMVQESKELSKQGVKSFAVCPGLVVSNLRGTSEDERTASGVAVDPEVSGKLMLDIITGKRDADVGKFVHKDGVYPW